MIVFIFDFYYINQIYTIGFILWFSTIPLALYHGYNVGKQEFEKYPSNCGSNLIVIAPQGIKNYTIFMYCCAYCLIYFGLSLLISLLVIFLYNIIYII